MLKIGIIGSGSMGKNHARVCAELEDVELVGVADIDKETAKKVAEKFGTQVFFDYRNLLSEIDAVIVATPTVTHHKIVMDLLTHIPHILI